MEVFEIKNEIKKCKNLYELNTMLDDMGFSIIEESNSIKNSIKKFFMSNYNIKIKAKNSVNLVIELDLIVNSNVIIEIQSAELNGIKLIKKETK